MPGDPPERIFDDVGHLYRMRSNLVHGTPIRERDWERVYEAMDVDDITELFDVRLMPILDRWRDLVRRAILTRLLLEQPPKKWPSDGNLDAAISGPTRRREWRRDIRDRARTMHLGDALRPVGRLRPPR